MIQTENPPLSVDPELPGLALTFETEVPGLDRGSTDLYGVRPENRHAQVELVTCARHDDRDGASFRPDAGSQEVVLVGHVRVEKKRAWRRARLLLPLSHLRARRCRESTVIQLDPDLFGPVSGDLDLVGRYPHVRPGRLQERLQPDPTLGTLHLDFGPCNELQLRSRLRAPDREGFGSNLSPLHAQAKGPFIDEHALCRTPGRKERDGENGAEERRGNEASRPQHDLILPGDKEPHDERYYPGDSVPVPPVPGSRGPCREVAPEPIFRKRPPDPTVRTIFRSVHPKATGTRTAAIPASTIACLALLALALWVRTGFLSAVGGALLLGVGAILLGRDHARPLVVPLALILTSSLLALVAHLDLGHFTRNWPERFTAWELRVQDDLARDLDRVLRAAESSAERLAAGWTSGWDAEAPLLPAGLTGRDVQAVAVFGRDGRLLAWDGTHQGPFPQEVRLGAERYRYVEGPLFGYLYVTHPLARGQGTVVSASLLRADLPPGLDRSDNDLESRFERDRRASITISRPERVRGESVWDFRWDGRSLFSVTLEPLSEATDRARRSLRWERAVAAGLLAAWLALLLATGGGIPMVGAALTLPLLLLALPLGPLLGVEGLFAPTGFLLPFVPGVTLGDLLALGLASAFLLGIAPPGLRGLPVGARLAPLAVAVAVVLGLGLLLLLGAGASRELLTRGEGSWIAFQCAGVILLGLAFTLALKLSPSSGGRVRIPLLLLGLGLAGGLAAAAAGQVRSGPGLPLAAGVLWVVPLLLTAFAIPGAGRWGMGFLRIALGFTLAATLVLPWGWSLRVEARMALAEEGVERLSTRPDSFLEFLLLRAGEVAGSEDAGGLEPIELLHAVWSRSGLAAEGIPVWISLHDGEGVIERTLRMGVLGERPVVGQDLVRSVLLEGGVRLRRFDLADVHYLAAAPLRDGRAVSILVPPRRTLEARAPLGPLFSPARSERDPLVLIPLLPGEAPGATEGIEWEPSPQGWQGELYLVYPDEVYHAHYIIELPANLLVLARGTLLLLLGFAPALLAWGAGRRVAEGEVVGGGAVWTWVTSFRGRVTLALFVFFLLPSLLFGTLAYRTLSGAATRTAGVLAERAVEGASAWYLDAGGAMDVLTRRTGSDLLLYDRGELVGASVPEMLELGLYPGWMPPAIHRTLSEGEDLTMTTEAALGGWDYVVAYRRSWGGQVIAAPAPLAAGALALRQRDVADLLGFAVVLGAALSVLLSLVVGRALARPIQILRIASERVGAGNMEVQLDEDRGDEFGAVFGAFNRMVDRLGRTRRALERSARRTRAIIEEVATGIVALDASGRVTLANTRAEALLGVALVRGRPLPAEEESAAGLAEWADGMMESGAREGGTELQMGERRIRVRARRVRRRGPPGGLVFSLEDVTDELRTERILAWGEMARQVAHEVKNPLTPIKLGVQHIQRAHEDRRPEFDEILDRNVAAILREIDRLAEIASSFSRFGAPDPLGSGPMEEVTVVEVVEEVLALYEGGQGSLRVDARGLDVLPPVRARATELKEVLVNLLENARGALPAGGRVELTAESDDTSVHLKVRDEGEGMTPELLLRAFEPHFSTRSGGSGLGLAIVRRLVESWGGMVRAESVPTRGTTVFLTLPRWDRSSDRS